jgi:DNA-binding LacI/PurR family transcriptional regulator
MTWTRVDPYCLRLVVPTTGAASIATPTITVAYSEARRTVSYVLHAGPVVLGSRPCIDTDDAAARRQAVAELQEQGAAWHAQAMAASETRRTKSC